MPIPVLENGYSPELQRLILLLESDLHFIASMQLTREQAIDLKQRFMRPLGILNNRYQLKNGDESRAERLARKT